jgi:hypothetical protein
MRFVAGTGHVSDAALVYRASEYAFNTDPRPTTTDTSVLVNTLELRIDRSTKQVVFVEGYCPYHAWKAASLSPPPHRTAALHIADTWLERGVSVALTPRSVVRETCVDPQNGWICIRTSTNGGDAVEFAPGCVAVLECGQIHSLWLHPRELPEAILRRGVVR